MSDIEITPALLADIEHKAKRASGLLWGRDCLDIVVYNNLPDSDEEFTTIGFVENDDDANFIVATDPAVVLAMIERIRQLEEERQEAVDALYQWVYGVKYEDRDEVANALSQAVEIARREDGKA